MKHQTGRTFDEFQKNPNLEKAVAIIRIDLNEYSCKKHIIKNHVSAKLNALTRESIVLYYYKVA